MKYRYAEMIWNETRDAAAAGRVAVLPVATHEDHGPHLPVDTDVVLCHGICERAVARIPEEAVLAPPVTHGYSPHHMDFHGTLTITWDTFIRYVKDVCCSLAHHGFKRILIVNGHGSNTSPLDLAARLTVLEYEGQILCASVNHWDIRRAKTVGNELRDSDYGGTSHAANTRPRFTWRSSRNSSKWTRPLTSARRCRPASALTCWPARIPRDRVRG